MKTIARGSVSSRFFAIAMCAAAAVGYACGPSSSELTSAPFQGGPQSTDDAGGGDGGVDPSASPITPASPSARRIRRLTVAEYTNTMNDLLGTNQDYGATLPADPVANGFDDDADALEVDALFADEARIDAENVAAGYDLNSIGCQASAGESCARQFVQSFGAKALRRPVTSDEVNAYAQLFDSVSAASDADSGMRAILEAMLQSPSFLYRTELGVDGATPVSLTSWEIASELSYLFWRTMPDDELRQHATVGDLTQPTVVAQEVTRLLASPRANAMLDSFADQWLEVSLLQQSNKDSATFPTYSDAVRADMQSEAHAFFEANARDPSGTLATLLTSTTSYASANLAQFYGDAPDRGGVLTLGAILSAQATPKAANPVRRGKLVRTQFFCEEVGAPPPGVVGNIPPLDPSTANRATWEQHESDPACSGCHKMLDPIGFGFDKFDAVGRELTGTVDTTGQINGTPSSDGAFDGVRDLATKLSESADVQACFVKQWVRFGLGVGDTDASNAEVARLAALFPKGQAGVTALLQAMTQATYFYRRDAEVIPPP